MKKNAYTVVVSECTKSSTPGSTYILGERLAERHYDKLVDAMEEGHFQIGRERAVIVRPNFNEQDGKGHFFREWRSFDGSKLKEVRFYF